MKLVPKCSTPLSIATANRRFHCDRGGTRKKPTSSAASRPMRMAVNRNGGTSRNACAEVRKLVAQNRQTSRTRTRSRPCRPRAVTPSPADIQLAIGLGQHPCRSDEQVLEVGEEARLLALVELAVADELRNPRDHEYAQRELEQA